ncbi:MAG: nucleotidyltransferase domain-containing protein [Candidatus Eremiobacterota bacterium]
MLRARDGIREVEAQLTRYLAGLRRRLDCRAVVVAGSRARGGHCTDSDIDLVVVSEAFRGMAPAERTGLLLQDWYDIPTLQPQGYTPEEVLAPRGLFLWDALCDARALEDDGIWAQGRRRFEARIRSGELTRTPGGWRVKRA